MMRSRPEPGPFWRPANMIALLVLALLGAGVAFSLIAYRQHRAVLPSIDGLEERRPGSVSRFYARDGRVIFEIASGRAETVPLEEMPRMLYWTLLAAGDPAFHRHDGIDERRLAARALRKLLRRPGGGDASTLTMRFAEELFPTREGSVERKFEEMILAREIEERYAKDLILEMFLNQAYFGEGAFGIEAAARTFFGKGARKLDLAESALLVGLLESPARLNPRVDLPAARARRGEVLDALVEMGYDRAAAERLKAREVDLAPPPEDAGPGSYFTDYAWREAVRTLGMEGLWQGGYAVHTTVDSRLQEAAERILEEHLARMEVGLPDTTITRAEWRANRERAGRHRGAREGGGATSYLQGALLAIDLESGGIIALVGGRDYDESPFDRVSHARRRAGSILEPLVWSAAIREGRGTQPTDARSPEKGPGASRPAALRSVHLGTEVGMEAVVDYAREAGITTDLPGGSSAALGEAEVLPWQVLQAFTIYPTRGERLQPIAISRILDRNGVKFRSFEASRSRVLTPDQASAVTVALRETLERLFSGRPGAVPEGAAGAVGATNPVTDAWFVGFTPRYAALVWVGFDDGRPLSPGATGGGLAAPIWREFMEVAYDPRF